MPRTEMVWIEGAQDPRQALALALRRRLFLGYPWLGKAWTTCWGSST